MMMVAAGKCCIEISMNGMCNITSLCSHPMIFHKYIVAPEYLMVYFDHIFILILKELESC